MLDVILYRIDAVGRIHLAERTFESLQVLAQFFASDEGDSWDWAEIDGATRGETRRYSAEELRAILV